MATIQPIDSIVGFGDTRWAIDGVVSGLTVVWSAPGVGKTFTAISMAVSVALGEPWMGRRTNPGRIVYVAGEGSKVNLAYRVRTALKEWTVDLDDKEDVARAHFDVISPGIDFVENVQEFVDLTKLDSSIRLIIVDTLSRCFIGDENKQEYMGKFVRALDLLREHYKCDILIIHHANKSKGIRGSSVLMGAVDVCWELKKAGGRPSKDGNKHLSLHAEKLRERDAADITINMQAVSKPIMGPFGIPVRNEFGALQSTLIIKPTKGDLDRAKTVSEKGLAYIENKRFVDYEDLRNLHGLKGMSDSDFDSALSFVLTSCGKFGIMRGSKPGRFVKDEEGVDNVW